MRNLIIIFVVILVVAIITTYIYYGGSKKQPPSQQPVVALPIAKLPPTPLPPAESIFCVHNQVQTQLTTQGAAGNIYGNLTIKNISGNNCQIIGNNNLALSFDKTVKNITVSPQGQPTAQTFTLAPGQTIYSQIHFPNGPQCSGAPKQIPVTLSYKLSPTESVTFKTPTGTTLPVPSCSKVTEVTNIQTWPLSDKPISQ